MGERPDSRSESILDSNQIDSEIDSDLIVEGRTEMRIDNRFFLAVRKGLELSWESVQIPGQNRFGFKSN